MKASKLSLIGMIAVLGLSLILVGWTFSPQLDKEHYAHPPIHVRGNTASTVPNGYNPVQIKHAYGIDQLTNTGSGNTIAIIEAYGSPTIQNDLDVFCSTFNLKPANLKIVYPQGRVKKTDVGWATETALDVEWVHALAPDANILLVVAKSASLSDLLAAVDYATKNGAQVVSMSWGASEFSGESSYDSHFSHSGTVYLASAGDNGAGVIWPAASPNVVSVGGTTLKLDASGNLTGPETAWSGSGGGISSFEPEPSYQINYGILTNGHRGVPDVAFDADPSTGVSIYCSTTYNGSAGWFVVGGTSFGAPAWSALAALADQSRSTPLAGGHDALYKLATGTAYASNYRDITAGSNGNTAGPGYDLVTGLGTPLANNLVPCLSH